MPVTGYRYTRSLPSQSDSWNHCFDTRSRSRDSADSHPDVTFAILDVNSVDPNDLLAFNDGMLSDHLEKTEGLTSEESEKRIREFVEDTKSNPSPFPVSGYVSSGRGFRTDRPRDRVAPPYGSRQNGDRRYPRNHHANR